MISLAGKHFSLEIKRRQSSKCCQMLFLLACLFFFWLLHIFLHVYVASIEELEAGGAWLLVPDGTGHFLHDNCSTGQTAV